MSNNSHIFQRDFVIEVEVPGAEKATSVDQHVFDGVRIFPLRFGLFDVHRESELSFISNASKKCHGLTEVEGLPKFGPETKKNPKTITPDQTNVAVASSTAVKPPAVRPFLPRSRGVQSPESFEYHYYPFPLNEGYLYITSKLSEGVYEFDYLWNSGMVFSRFISEKESADHHAKNGFCFYAHIQDELRLFYSPTPLPASMVLEELYRNVHPQQTKIDCRQWRSHGEGKTDLKKGILEDVDAWVALPPNSDKRINRDTQKFIYESYFSYTIQNNEAASNDCTTRDVFVLLNDPLGLVTQVNEDLTNAHLAHEALVRSIRTGINPEEIVRILKAHEDGGSLSDQELVQKINLNPDHRNNLDQIFYIHSLASGLYRAIFDDNHKFPKAEKAEDNIDRERLIKVLAVYERSEFHKKIEGHRYALKTALASDFFQSFCAFFHQAKEPDNPLEKRMFWDSLIEVKACVGTVYANMAQRPFDKDEILNLSTAYGDTQQYASDDPGYIAIKALNNEENEAGKLINRVIKLEDYLDSNYGKKTAGKKPPEEEININASLIGKYITTTHQVLTAITKVGFTPLEIKFCKTVNTELGRAVIPLTQNEVVERLNKIAGQQGGMRYEAVAGTWKRTIEGEKGTVTIDIRRARISKLERVAHAVATNPLFTLVIDLLAIKGATNITKAHPIRNTLDVAALVVTVQNTYAKYSQLVAATKPSLVHTGTRALRISWGTAGAYIGVAIDVVDGVETWSERDYDAMSCSIVSASAGLSSLAIAAFYAKASWAGWAGLSLATIAIGTKFLYAHFKDTPFEGFVKKTMFYDWFRYKLKDKCYDNLFILGSEDSRRDSLEAMTNKDELYMDVSYLLEAFIYLHSCLFNFEPQLSFIKKSVPVCNMHGKLIGHRPVIIEIMLNVSSDLSLLAADIQEVEMECYFVKDQLDLWLGHQAEPTPLFKNKGYQPLFVSRDVAHKLNNYLALTNDERAYLNERQRYSGIEEAELKNSRFKFCYRKKLGEVTSFEGKSLEFEGTEPIAAEHGEDNHYFVLMVKMKTSDGHFIPMPHSTTKEERWLCYTYASTLAGRANKAELAFKESGIYTKNTFWKKTI
ncbi:hypothetical protein [Geofilum rubicundum]|nr:hypothetical protein [Geofilum rubicundum]